jgi:hypothetical protein
MTEHGLTSPLSVTDELSSPTAPLLANSYSNSLTAEITSDIGITSGGYSYARPAQPTDTLSLLDKITKRAKLVLVLMQEPQLVSDHAPEFILLSAYLVEMGGTFTSSDPTDTTFITLINSGHMSTSDLDQFRLPKDSSSATVELSA